MQWLNSIVDEVMARHPAGEVLIESGGSPSGTHHLGHMRELVICDAILLELRRRGRQARHIYFVDDLDNLRKIPVNVPSDFEKYLGVPICDVPAPDGSDQSYADYFLQTLIDACAALSVEVEFIRSHQKYRTGFFVPAIERCLEHIPEIRHALETVSGRTLDKNWSPIQVLEEGRLKKRAFLGIDTKAKTVAYEDKQGAKQTVSYEKGQVKLDWRLDWPGRWWLLNVLVEPSGRDHMTKGSSYDTGVQIMREVYDAEPPYPVSYDFINMVGDTKKMSASKGTGLDAVEGATIMPPEVVRYFILKAPPLKRLYFDPVNGVVQLMDEFAQFAAKSDKTKSEEQLWDVAMRGAKGHRTVSRVPFSHLVASYQASLKDADKTLEVIGRTEHARAAKEDADIIRDELKFIDAWLDKRAPAEVKFSLRQRANPDEFSVAQKAYLAQLAQEVESAPDDADGEWFHKAIYDLKEAAGLPPKELFSSLYRLIIGKDAGPRAGWFLSQLPRDWLIRRLRLEDSVVNSQTIPQEHRRVDIAKLAEKTSFHIDPAIRGAFPEAAVGYLVATLPPDVHEAGEDWLTESVQALSDRGITADTLRNQPEIESWRRAYATFGVKPSKYLASVEALAKRALREKPARVSPVVDLYNAVSLKYLLPMGAMDLDRIQGDIELRYGRAGESVHLLGFDKPVQIEPTHPVYADQNQIISWLWNHRDAAETAVTKDTCHAVFFVDSLIGVEPVTRALEELTRGLKRIGAKVTTSGILK